MSAHPLTTFVFETFGRQFGDLLLTGYGAEPGGERRRLYLTESDAGDETGWVIEHVASRPPCRDEPLVLAALLKLLLRRPSISHDLEFELGELLAELRWQDDAHARHQAEAAIGVYVRLLYEKQVDGRAGQRASSAAGGGYYHLLTAYFRGAKDGADGDPAKTYRGVYFDEDFAAGLKRGRVYFAGIDFGPLYGTHDRDRA